LHNKELEQKLTPMSEEEVAENNKLEVEGDLAYNKVDDDVRAPKSSEAEATREPPNKQDQSPGQIAVRLYGAYRDTERKLQVKLRSCFRGEYEVLENKRIGSAQFDVILASKSDDTRDLVVELKYYLNFDTSRNYHAVRETLLQRDLYEKVSGRNAIPVLVVVLEPQASARVNKEWYRQRALEQGNSEGLIALFLGPEGIDGLTCNYLRNLFATALD
jgi:hypothetical protein